MTQMELEQFSDFCLSRGLDFRSSSTDGMGKVCPKGGGVHGNKANQVRTIVELWEEYKARKDSNETQRLEKV